MRQWSVWDTRIADVARHIDLALNHPDETWPFPDDPVHHKTIPGRYTGVLDANGLHRLASPSEKQENRDWSTAACRGRAPYDVPAAAPPAPANPDRMDCDEYPFACTKEGAANSSYEGNFSVQWVDRSENRSAGGLLSWFLTSDRILYNNDPFYVEITHDNPPPGGYDVRWLDDIPSCWPPPRP